MARTPRVPAEEKPVSFPGLSPGWEVRSYTNARGRQNFACYVNGRRVSYGINTAEGTVLAAKRALGERARVEKAA